MKTCVLIVVDGQKEYNQNHLEKLWEIHHHSDSIIVMTTGGEYEKIHLDRLNTSLFQMKNINGMICSSSNSSIDRKFNYFLNMKEIVTKKMNPDVYDEKQTLCLCITPDIAFNLKQMSKDLNSSKYTRQFGVIEIIQYHHDSSDKEDFNFSASIVNNLISRRIKSLENNELNSNETKTDIFKIALLRLSNLKEFISESFIKYQEDLETALLNNECPNILPTCIQFNKELIDFLSYNKSHTKITFQQRGLSFVSLKSEYETISENLNNPESDKLKEIIDIVKNGVTSLDDVNDNTDIINKSIIDLNKIVKEVNDDNKDINDIINLSSKLPNNNNKNDEINIDNLSNLLSMNTNELESKLSNISYDNNNEEEIDNKMDTPDTFNPTFFDNVFDKDFDTFTENQTVYSSNPQGEILFLINNNINSCIKFSGYLNLLSKEPHGKIDVLICSNNNELIKLINCSAVNNIYTTENFRNGDIKFKTYKKIYNMDTTDISLPKGITCENINIGNSLTPNIYENILGFLTGNTSSSNKKISIAYSYDKLQAPLIFMRNLRTLVAKLSSEGYHISLLCLNNEQEGVMDSFIKNVPTIQVYENVDLYQATMEMATSKLIITHGATSLRSIAVCLKPQTIVFHDRDHDLPFEAINTTYAKTLLERNGLNLYKNGNTKLLNRKIISIINFNKTMDTINKIMKGE